MSVLPLPMPGSTQPKTTIDDNTRLMNKLYYIVSVMLVLASCAGSKHDTTDNSPYRRKPIVEVTESQLRADSAMIDATTQMLLGNYEKGVELYQRLLRDSATYAPQAHLCSRKRTPMNAQRSPSRLCGRPNLCGEAAPMRRRRTYVRESEHL